MSTNAQADEGPQRVSGILAARFRQMADQAQAEGRTGTAGGPRMEQRQARRPDGTPIFREDGAPDLRWYVDEPKRETAAFGFPAGTAVPENPNTAGWGKGPLQAFGFRKGWALDWPPGCVAYVTGPKRSQLVALAFYAAHKLDAMGLGPVRFASAMDFQATTADGKAAWNAAPVIDYRTLVLADVIGGIGPVKLAQVAALLSERRGRSVIVLGEVLPDRGRGEAWDRIRGLLEHGEARMVNL